MTTLNDFIAKWSGQKVDTDGIYPNQCMDLMHQYCIDMLELSPNSLGAPAAKDVFLQFPNLLDEKDFDKIDNTPTNIPEEGDLIFWGTQIGEYGHVSIFINGDENTFTSFDANWPLGSLPHIQLHNYSGILGWLHPKSLPTPSQPTQPPLVTEKFMTFELVQVTGTNEVYMKTVPAEGANPLLVPISRTDMNTYFGDNPPITALSSLDGQGETVLALIDGEVNAAVKPYQEQLSTQDAQLQTLHTQLDTIVKSADELTKANRDLNTQNESLKAALQNIVDTPRPPVPTTPKIPTIQGMIENFFKGLFNRK